MLEPCLQPLCCKDSKIPEVYDSIAVQVGTRRTVIVRVQLMPLPEIEYLRGIKFVQCVLVEF